MIISLWQLNESYQPLVRLAQREFPKERHKLAYRLSRVVKSAKAEVEVLGESLNALMAKCDDSDRTEQATKFMKETECEIWGEPMLYTDFAGVVVISPMDLALLDWLIIEETSTGDGQ
jgi:hypothetical protein